MTDTVDGRIGRLDWDELAARLDQQGFAVTASVLDQIGRAHV